MMKYKLALCLFIFYNKEFNCIEFVNLNINQVFTGRQLKFKILKTINFKVGLNALANRLHCLNDNIPLTWLNMSINTFKVLLLKIIVQMVRLLFDLQRSSILNNNLLLKVHPFKTLKIEHKKLIFFDVVRFIV